MARRLPHLARGVRLMLDATAIDTAARTAWGEARGEGLCGMQAVLNVIGNRAAHPGWWGRDITSVCRAPWQFSCWNADDPNAGKIASLNQSDPQYRTAHELALQLVAGALVDLTDGADSYYRHGSPVPMWALPRFFIKTIGHHDFYRIGLHGDGA
ncbi:cell wall hydrolase [Komagataeibacter diospyri]|uniref:Cell wall hydrolyse n=1 Tax=Komagataeibacter diospyri TaxID=1932662 RepID=A0A4P5NZ29_9PROT|nr:cell wall hydrolase [Komagataeibacter diospyri]GCE83116.1 cell wall hydrolyse [Komagataeibacter diospyri]